MSFSLPVLMKQVKTQRKNTRRVKSLRVSVKKYAIGGSWVSPELATEETIRERKGFLYGLIR